MQLALFTPKLLLAMMFTTTETQARILWKETGHYFEVVFPKVTRLTASSKHLIMETSVDVGGV